MNMKLQLATLQVLKKVFENKIFLTKKELCYE